MKSILRACVSLSPLYVAFAAGQYVWIAWHTATFQTTLTGLHEGPIVLDPSQFLDRALEALILRPEIFDVATGAILATAAGAFASHLLYPQLVSAKLSRSKTGWSFAIALAAETLWGAIVQRLYMLPLQVGVFILGTLSLRDALGSGGASVIAFFSLVALWGVLQVIIDHTRAAMIHGDAGLYHPRTALFGFAALIQRPRRSATAWLLWIAQVGLVALPALYYAGAPDVPPTSPIWMGAAALFLATLRYITVHPELGRADAVPERPVLAQREASTQES